MVYNVLLYNTVILQIDYENGKQYDKRQVAASMLKWKEMKKEKKNATAIARTAVKETKIYQQ